MTTQTRLILITPLFLLLTHYLAMLPHEYLHSFTAWLLGDKTNPFALHYGGTSWSNLLLLLHMDENVNYPLIFSAGHGEHAALIAFAGLGFANIPLYFLSLWFLRKQRITQKPFLCYFLFLFNVMNIGNFYDYVPIRTFGTHGDARHFWQGLQISPWWVYFMGGYLVAIVMWHFFKYTLQRAYSDLKLNQYSKAGLMMLSVLVLFGFFGCPGFYHYGTISYFLSATSLLAIPGIMMLLWPK